MSAIVFQGARHASADTAGVTQTDLSNPGLAFGIDAADAARRALAGALSPLESWMGGGIHPEAAIAPAASTDLAYATDSVVGRFGGHVPRPGSTVAPGPAGGAAQARSTFFKSLRSLFNFGGNSAPWDGQLGHPTPGTPGAGQVPAGPNGGPIPRDPGLPIGFG
jgi:hypothetical protein